MRLILAHRHDAAAHELAARWRGDALLLTPADLHNERIHLTVDPDGRPNATLPSRPAVTAILSRLGGVGPADLDHVDPRDVTYAATELDAFLRAWLLAWPGPVLNRPTTTCLNGPGWRPEQWAMAAAVVGLRPRPARRISAPPEPSPSIPPDPPSSIPPLSVPPEPKLFRPNPSGTPGRELSGPLEGKGVAGSPAPSRVTVVGNRWFGPVDAATGSRLCALARHAGCVLLDAWVSADGVMLHAGAWPELSTPDVAAALAALLDAPGATTPPGGIRATPPDGIRATPPDRVRPTPADRIRPTPADRVRATAPLEGTWIGASLGGAG